MIIKKKKRKHRNTHTKPETIIYKQKTSKTKYVQTKEYETKV